MWEMKRRDKTIFELKLFLDMTDGKIVAEKLLQANAVTLNVQEPYTWASGLKSPIYCDNRKLFSFPHTRDFIKSEMSNMIFDLYPDAELIAGVATAGIVWGVLVADQLKLPYIYVRPEPKQHGLGNQVEGSYEKGKKVVVVEDLISTGKSSKKVIDVLRDQGLVVEGLISIFTYGFEVAENLFSEAAIPFKSLSDFPTLVSVALEKGILSNDQYNTLLNWRKAPTEWKPYL